MNRLEKIIHYARQYGASDKKIAEIAADKGFNPGYVRARLAGTPRA